MPAAPARAPARSARAAADGRMRRCRSQPHPSQVEVQHRDATGPGQYPRAFDPKCNQKRITPAAAAGAARPRAPDMESTQTPATAAILGVAGCGDANAPAGRRVRGLAPRRRAGRCGLAPPARCGRPPQLIPPRLSRRPGAPAVEWRQATLVVLLLFITSPVTIVTSPRHGP